MMMSHLRALLARRAVTLSACLAVATATSTTLAAQEMRTLRVSHSVNDSTPLRVNIQYGVGTLNLEPANRSVLYDARLVYPADHSTPLATYDPAAHSLDLGIKDGTFELPDNDSGSVMHVQLARGVPLDLSLKIGAAQATLKLGGLAVRNFTLKAGATQTTLRFDTANTIRMQSLTIKVGAAQFEAHGLANARAAQMSVEGAAGEIELWFDGTWTGDLTLDSKILLGDMTIHVPSNVQVVSTAKAVLGNVSDASASSGSHASKTASSDTSDDDDMSDTDDDSMPSRVAKSQPQAQPQPQPSSQGHQYTLRVTGSATAGSLEILHDATPSH
jgi:hypothetical protein